MGRLTLKRGVRRTPFPKLTFAVAIHCEFEFVGLNSQRDRGNVLFTSREQVKFRHLGIRVTVRGYLKFDSFVNKPAKSFYSFPTICNPPTALIKNWSVRCAGYLGSVCFGAWP